jgi:hypothetical protein
MKYRIRKLSNSFFTIQEKRWLWFGWRHVSAKASFEEAMKWLDDLELMLRQGFSYSRIDTVHEREFDFYE